MSTEREAQPTPSVIEVAKTDGRIRVDGSIERMAATHGANNVFIDGRCYADILAEEEARATIAAEKTRAADLVRKEFAEHLLLCAEDYEEGRDDPLSQFLDAYVVPVAYPGAEPGQATVEDPDAGQSDWIQVVKP